MKHYHWSASIEKFLSSPRKAVAFAGAGTGKTAFTVDAVLHYLAGADSAPRKVICITFMTKAAAEFKQRMRELLVIESANDSSGYWAAQLRRLGQASICTIHAFALNVLEEHPLEAGLDIGFEVLTECESRKLRQRAVDNIIRKSFLNTGSPHAELVDRYGWESSGYQPGLRDLIQWAFNNWLEQGANQDFLSFSARKNWPEDESTGVAFADVILKMQAEYTALKGGALDYHDMIDRTVNLFRSNQEIRNEYRDSCDLVILDEAQDTAPLQMELISYLAQQSGDDGQWPRVELSDKLIIVGDIKQAVYRFRNADHLQFMEAVQVINNQGGANISLQDNRRCHHSIISFVNSLAPELFRDSVEYVPERDDLRAIRRHAESENRVWMLDNSVKADRAEERRAGEAEELAELILWLTSERDSPISVFDGDQARPPRFGDIAMLFPKMVGKVQYYTAALRQHNIPFHSEKGGSLFEAPEVRDAVSFLRLVQNPKDRLAMAELLRSPAAGLDDPEWLQQFQMADSTNAPDNPEFWLLQIVSKLRRIKDHIPIAELLDRWQQAVSVRPALAQFVEPRQGLGNLVRFQEIAREADAQGQSLREFVDELMVSMDDGAEPPASIFSPGENVVRLMTVHGVKGLEFKIVIVPDCTSDAARKPSDKLIWDRERGLVGKVWDASNGKIVDSAVYKKWAVDEKVRLIEDQQKLLYVAATRARDLLVFSGAYPSKRASKECWRRWIEENSDGQPSAASQCVRRISNIPIAPLGGTPWRKGRRGSDVKNL